MVERVATVSQCGAENCMQHLVINWGMHFARTLGANITTIEFLATFCFTSSKKSPDNLPSIQDGMKVANYKRTTLKIQLFSAKPNSIGGRNYIIPSEKANIFCDL